MLNSWSNNEKLKTSELRYRRLFETAQDGILILDAVSGKIFDANPFLEHILGYSQKELLNKELWQIGAFKDIVNSKAAFRQLQDKGHIRYEDLPLRTKDGKSIDVEFVSNVYSVGDQKVIQCNIRDITLRVSLKHKAEEKSDNFEKLNITQETTKKAMLNVMEDLESAKRVIELEKAKDEAVFESIGEGLIAVDNDRKITILNKKTEEMLGWNAKRLLGKIITTLPLEDEDGNFIPLEERPTYLALKTGKTIEVTYFFVKEDKTRFPLAINATPITLKGKVIGLVETLRDVTNESEIDKAKSEFVSLASHQLRTPLGIMKWYIEAMKEEEYFKKAPAETRKYINEVYKSNERILSLVRDLLSVSRIDQGKIKNAPKSINIVAVMREIVESLQVIAHKKRITLQLVIGPEHFSPVTIDSLRLHEAIENLITNAIEYTPSPGKVVVTLGKSGKSLTISVQDTGIGISKADQKSLFTKFFRSEKATNLNPEGSGLGLYVVNSYVKDWGGEMIVQSTEGKGSIFTVSLPTGGDVI